MNPQGILLTKLLGRFQGVFTAGMDRLTPECVWLLTVLLGIELLVHGMAFALRRQINWEHVVFTAIKASILLYFIQHFHDITTWVLDGFMGGGWLAGGSVQGLALTNPDAIWLAGFAATQDVFAASAKVSLLDVSGTVTAMLSGFVAIVVILIYLGIALAVFISLLEFYVAGTATLFLLPWGMFSKTAFLCERALAHVASSAVRLFIITVILSAAMPVILAKDAAPPVAGVAVRAVDMLTSGIMSLGSALTILALIWVAQKLCAGLVHGAPTLALADAATVLRHVTSTTRDLASTIQALTHQLQRGASSGSNGSHPAAPMPSQRRL